MKKVPKISIFLPIYNKEKYIYKIIGNLQNQTLKDIEIVTVNDYSNDNSLLKLMNLANNDSRIKIINNEKNHGLLYSRAMGILNSSGRYLMNLDPDDELESNNILEYLYNQTIITNADIISFTIYNKKSKKYIKCKQVNKILKQPELFNSIFKRNNLIDDYLIWNKLAKKEIFLKAYEEFRNEIYNGKWNYFEDNIWSILLNKHAKSKFCVNRLVYIYNYNKDSLMNKRFSMIEFKNQFYLHEKYKKIFISKEEKKYVIAEYFFLFNSLKLAKKNILLMKDKNITKNIIDIFSDFLSNDKITFIQRNKIIKFLKLLNESLISKNNNY